MCGNVTLYIPPETPFRPTVCMCPWHGYGAHSLQNHFGDLSSSCLRVRSELTAASEWMLQSAISQVTPI